MIKTLKKLSQNHTTIFYVVMPYLFLLLLHILLSIKIRHPWVFWDELVYLSQARYLAEGSFYNLLGAPSASFGYALFLTPLYFLFDEPLFIYKSVLFINSLLISTLYIALYYILRSLFGIKKNISTLISLSVCLYPAFLIQPNVAFTESLFIPAYAFLIFVFYKWLKKQTYFLSFLLGVLPVLIYGANNRGLGVLLVSFFYFLFLFFTKGIERKKIFFTLLIIISFSGLFFWANNYLSLLTPETKNTELTLMRLSNFFSIDGVSKIFFNFIGQILYLIQATYGIFVLALFYILSYLYQNIKNILKSSKSNTLLFLFFTSFSIFFLSNIYLTGWSRFDAIFYGRYNESFLAIFMAIGLSLVYLKKNISWKWPVFVIFIFSFILFFGLDRELFSLGYVSLNIWSINPILLFWPSMWGIILVSFLFVIFMIILFKSFQNSYILGTIFLSFLFCLITFLNFKLVILPAQKNVAFYTQSILELKAFEEINKISYDISYFKKGYLKPREWLWYNNFFLYQFLLPNIKFEDFDSQQGEIPQSAFVIAGEDFSDQKKIRVKNLIPGEQYLYVDFNQLAN